MRIFDLLRKNKAPDPGHSEVLARWEKHQQELDLYFQEHGLERDLSDNEIPLAVIMPKSTATSPSLRQIAAELQLWKSANPAVTRILGIERMFSGNLPLVAAELLMIPISFNNPETWAERVALAIVSQQANTKVLGKSLCRLLDRYPDASVFSWEQYSAMNR